MRVIKSSRIILPRVIILAAVASLCGFARALPASPYQTLYDAAFGEAVFVSVGANGAIYSSVNSGSWDLRASGTTNNLLAVVYGDGTFVVAGGNGTLLSSSNGVDWILRGTNGAWTAPKIAFGNGTFVVGAKGPGSVWTMLASTNAVDWVAVNIEANGPQDSPLPFGDIAFGEGRFLAVGGRHGANLIVTSTDGLIWREQGVNLPRASSAIEGPITYGNGKFAMVVNNFNSDDDDDGGSYFDQVLMSDDGVSWQNTSFGAPDVPALAAGDCVFVAASSSPSSNPIWYSRGNFWWTNVSLPAAMSVRAIAQGNGRFLAFGSDIMEFHLPPAGGPFPVYPETYAVSSGEYPYFYIDAPPCLDPPISYQWRKDDIPIPGQTNTWLQLSLVTTNDSGGYSVIAIDHAGLSATSTVATLTVTEYNPEPFPPQIFAPDTNYVEVMDFGSQDSLYSGASGWPLPAYQWRFNGALIPGATNNYLVFYNVDNRALGDYTVVVSNSLGSVTSSVITLTLRTAPPRLAFTVFNDFVLEGSDTRFYPAVIFDPGAPQPNYYVLKDGTNSFLPLAYYGQFAMRDITPADEGQYMIVASNAFGMSTGLVANLTVIPGGRLDRWTRRNPLPQNDPLLEVAYGNARWVAVGERGNVVVSTNGSDWLVYPLKVDITLNSVTYGNGLFVAAGAGAILTSPDGITWTTRLNQYYPGFPPRTVLFANGRFVAAGLNSVLTSTDGIVWAEATLPLHVSPYFNVMAYGNGRFVAISGSGPVWTSTDGVNWTSTTNGPTAPIADLAFGNGLFVAVGDEGAVYTSPDGAVWTFRDSDVSNRLIDITFGNGRFVAVGTRGRIISSANGASWRRETSGTPDRLEGVAFAEGLFIAVGENGTILSSPNTTAWTKRNQGVTRDLDGMAVGNGTIVVVGKGGSIVTSVDGSNFIQRASGSANDLHGVAWADGLFVAVGEPETILTSPDGIAWTLRHSETNSSLKGAAKANGKWIAVGTGGTILTSSDGVAWTRRESYTLNDLNSVAYGNGLFVAVGDNLPPNGTLLTSPDGISWTRRNQYIGKNLRAVAFGNNTFVASGNDGVIMVSSNGLNWTLRFTGLFGQYDHNLRGIGYDGAMWVIVGNEGLVLTSPNALDWLLRSRQGVDNLHAVAEINGTFVAIGNRGTILRSDSYFQVGPLLRGRFVGNGVELTIHGDLGSSFTLEASPSLTGGPWTTIGGIHTFPPGNTSIVLFDPTPANSNTRFYRVVSR